MASSLVGVSSNLEQIDLKKNNVRKAILRLAVEWKDLDEYLDSTHNFYDEFEEKKIYLESTRDWIIERKRNLDSDRESLRLRLEELECREEKFCNFQLARIEEIKMKEEKMTAERKWIVDRMKEFLLEDETLIKKRKSMEVLLEDLVDIQKSVGENLNLVGLKERLCKERCKEVELREKQVVVREEQLKEREIVDERRFKEMETKFQVRSEELDSREKQVVFRCKKLDSREKQVAVRYEELDSREKQLVFRSKEIDSREKQVAVRSGGLDSREKQVVVREEQLEEGEIINDRHYNEIEIKMQVRSEELDSREKQVELREERIKEIEYNQEYFNRFEIKVQGRFKDLDSLREFTVKKAEELDSREKELELKEEKFKSIQKFNVKESEIKGPDVDSSGVLKLDSERKQVKFVLKSTKQSQTKQIKSLQKFNDKESETKGPDDDSSGVLKLDSERKQVKFFLKSTKPLQTKQIEATRKLLQERTKIFEIKGKQSEPEKSLSNGKQLQDTIWKGEKMGNDEKDGRNLQAYLNEKFKDPETDANKIIRLSLDPAKLVLDAMEGFYPPHLKKGDIEFETSVVSRSCNLLLEQLMILSPQIRPDVRERAVKLAGEWKLKIDASVKAGYELGPWVVLAFLQLFASYKLASEFNADEILELLMFLPVEKQKPEFCMFLGLQEKVYDFIKRLVEKGLHLDAIKYICAFKVGDEFPPATILKDYISYKEERDSLKTQDSATRKELKALKAVMSTVKLHNLESQYPLDNLKIRVKQLENQLIDCQSKQEKIFDFGIKSINEKKRKHVDPEDDTPIQTLCIKNLLPFGPPICPVGPTSGPSTIGQSGFSLLPPPPHLVPPYCPMGPTFGPSYMNQSNMLFSEMPPHLEQPYNPAGSTADMSQSGPQSGLRGLPYYMHHWSTAWP